MYAIADSTTLLDRMSDTIARARTLRALASRQQRQARSYRRTVAERRGDTVRAIWRSRQLRYDRHGQIVAIWNGDGPAGEDAVVLNDVINRLFGVSLSLSASLETMTGPSRAPVETGIKAMDELIRDIRSAAFTLYRPAEGPLPPYAWWLERIREVTANIDEVVDSAPKLESAVCELREAGQAVLRAAVANDPVA